jgi:glycosyltransferase involved in cell wall biosynthesis
MLHAALQALRCGTRQPDELWIVDDESQQDVAAVAVAFGANVLRMENNVGPAACRNLGVLQTISSILVFFDADTWVHTDTLQRIEAHFIEDPSLAAVIGAYDDAPHEPGIISQYRNLAHCYIHRSSNPNALTFWSGCGGVRRDAFFLAGGFDERYRRPSVEDIEFGYRLAGQGQRIRLDPSILVKHAKRWTIQSALVTDVWDRGIPWMRLLLQRRSIPNDLNIRKTNRASTTLTGLAILAAMATHYARFWWLVCFALIGAALCLHIAMFHFVARRRAARYLASCALFLLGEVCNLIAIPAGAIAWLFAARHSQRCSCIREHTSR